MSIIPQDVRHMLLSRAAWPSMHSILLSIFLRSHCCSRALYSRTSTQTRSTLEQNSCTSSRV
jgi:hypothetical protein